MTLKWHNEQTNKEYDFLSDSKCNSIEGIGIEKEVNSSSIAGYDGSVITSTSTPEREISLSISIPNTTESRLKLVSVVSGYGSLFVDDKFIDGFVSGIDYSDTSALSINAQISIICPDPYFHNKDQESKIMASVTPLFRFPHLFNGDFMLSKVAESVIDNFFNKSTVDVQPIIYFKANSALANPSIMNVSTYEKSKLLISMSANDVIRIDTRIGKKTIHKITNNGETNIFNCIAGDFKFLKLYAGDNWLKYDADTNPNGLQVTLQWTVNYGGV